MPGWQTVLTDEEMWNMVRFIRHLPSPGSAGVPQIFAEEQEQHEHAHGAAAQGEAHEHTHAPGTAAHTHPPGTPPHTHGAVPKKADEHQH